MYHRGGEPLLYPYLFDLIAYARNLNLEVRLYTNGAMITNSIAKLLLKYSVHVTIKLDSFNLNINDKLYGKKDSYKLTRYVYNKGDNKITVRLPLGLKNLLEVYLNKKNLLRINTVITKINYQCVPKIAEFCRDNDIEIHIETLIWKNRALKHRKALELTLDEYKTLYTKLVVVLGEDFKEAQKSGYCIHADNLSVFENGDVSSCLMKIHTFGNIRRRPLAALARVRENCPLKGWKTVNNFRTCKGRQYYSQNKL